MRVTHQNEKTDMEEAKQSYAQEKKGNIKKYLFLGIEKIFSFLGNVINTLK